MRRMVLDLRDGQPAAVGEAGRGIVGMQVAGDAARFDGQQARQVVGRRFLRAARLGRLQVADVLAEKDLAAARERHGVLQVAADRQQRRRGAADRNRQRRITPRAAQHLFAPRHDADD